MVQLLPLGRRQPGPALRAIRAHPVDPNAERRGRQIQIAGHCADRLALVEHQAHGLSLEVVIEHPLATAGLAAFRDIVSTFRNVSTKSGSSPTASFEAGYNLCAG